MNPTRHTRADLLMEILERVTVIETTTRNVQDGVLGMKTLLADHEQRLQRVEAFNIASQAMAVSRAQNEERMDKEHTRIFSELNALTATKHKIVGGAAVLAAVGGIAGAVASLVWDTFRAWLQAKMGLS
jgi:putative NADH-flavin reductase